MPEYAFNVDIRAIIRVKAETMEKAREKALELHVASIAYFAKTGCELKDFSLHHVEELILERDGFGREGDTEHKRSSRVTDVVG